MSQHRRTVHTFLTTLVILATMLIPCGTSVGAGERMPGRRVDIGGYALHIDCRGQGSPAVILDAGLGGSAVDWSSIQKGLAATTRVCAYDRAGYGWSDSGPFPRTSRRIAAELRTLLERAHIPPPYILVGHSFGGYNMRLFASLYPQETAGLVLVDAPHEGQLEDFLQYYLLGQIDPHGLLQPFWRPELLADLTDTDLAPFAPWFGMAPKTLRAILGEMTAFDESSQELRTADVQPDLPLVVIMHGRRVFPEGALGDRLEQQWLELQRELASRYQSSTFIIAQESAHNVLFEQPELIVSAIRKLLAGVSPAGKNR
jgi:pimeloyl-ACP methyl ester carboxylesterase